MLPDIFDTIDTPSLIRKILTLSQHSTYASMLALYIEDKTKFRKQDVSSPNSVVQLVQKKKKFLFLDIKFFRETRSADSENHLGCVLSFSP